MPIFVLAQADGTLPEPRMENLIAPAKSETSTTSVAIPRATSTTDVATSSGSTTNQFPELSEVVSDDTTLIPETSSSWAVVPYIAVALALGFGLFAFAKLNMKKKNEKKEEREEDNGRCFDIKKLMEEKLDELTDLKGHLQDKVKDKTREEIKEMMNDTAFAGALSAIEVGEKEYERLKKLFEQCMIDAGQSVKTLKFKNHLVPLILKGEKTMTWRLFDDKDLQVGDTFICKASDTNKDFATAKITSVVEKKLGKVTKEDYVGHEEYENQEKMLNNLKNYYGDKVNLDTVVKIIKFELI